MKLFSRIALAALLCVSTGLFAEAPTVRVVNFKTCVEQSKIGKQEQASFEALKKQMESVMEEKEKTLNDLATKFEDPDFLDSLSLEAETELKRKFRALSQEYSQQQNQYLQALNQTNIKIIQKLTDAATSAATQVAKTEKIDVVLSEEAAFFYQPALDISSKVVAVMDAQFDKDQQDNKTGEKR